MKWADNLIARVEAKKVEVSTAPPTYPIGDVVSADEARERLDQVIGDFICKATDWRELSEDDAESEDDAKRSPQPPVHAIRISTGVGKTRRVAALIARDRLKRRAAGETGPMTARSWLYLVPTHRLGEDIAQQFRDHGLSAKVYRGRTADDPNNPPKKMCLEPELVEVAQQCGLSISESCCKQGKIECRSFVLCGFQAQLSGTAPDIWITAHQMLFHQQKEFGEVAGIVIDEAFYANGISGIGEGGTGIVLDDIAPPREDAENPFRNSPNYRLVKALRKQPKVGGLERIHVERKFHAEECTTAIKREWAFINSLIFGPNVTPEQLAAVKREMPAFRLARRMIGIWGALRELLQKPEIKVSGRLILDKNDEGKTVLKRRGVRPIIESRNAPTLIMDATLPDVSILRAFYPQVEIVAEVEASMPHVRVRQVLSAPVSKRRLFGRHKGEHNIKAIRRYVLQRWLETGRKPMLVVCQKKVEEWLREAGLPDGIAIEHFNNISGIDRYKDVRTLILIGRTIPGPQAVEAFAGALTGAAPIEAATTGNWYDRVVRGIRLADGTGVAVECDEYPDPLAEAVRWQICEGELLQALGRARGVNRTAETPLDVHILADVVLPVTVDEVVLWERPSPIVEMLVSGLALIGSPRDMVKAWKEIWPKLRTAERAVQAFMERRRGARGVTDRQNAIEETLLNSEMAVCKSVRAEDEPAAALGAGWLRLTYRLPGRRKHTVAFHDPAVLPVPRPKMEELLGSSLPALFHHIDRPEVLGGDGCLRVAVDHLAATEVPIGNYETLPIELRLMALCLPMELAA
jgi:putative DNA primase/helicase